MPFWISLLSSVLLVVNASNDEFHNWAASAMSPVSSHNRVPASRTLRHSRSSFAVTAGLPNLWANPSRTNSCTRVSRFIMANSSIPKSPPVIPFCLFVVGIHPHVKSTGCDRPIPSEGSSEVRDSSNRFRFYPPLLAVGAFHKEPLAPIFADGHSGALREPEMDRRVRQRGEACLRLARHDDCLGSCVIADHLVAEGKARESEHEETCHRDDQQCCPRLRDVNAHANRQCQQPKPNQFTSAPLAGGATLDD